MPSQFVVVGRVYPVADEYPTVHARHAAAAPDDWCEYRCALLTRDGQALREWNSLFETFNGRQYLDAAGCAQAIRMIQDEVDAGRVSDWFDW